MEASASAACSPGDGCLKLSSAGLQRVPHQHLMSSVFSSSPNNAIKFGISSIAFLWAAAHAACARSCALEVAVCTGTGWRKTFVETAAFFGSDFNGVKVGFTSNADAA